MKVKDTNEISHKGKCESYKKFVTTLRSVNYKQFCDNVDKEGFVKPLP